MRIGDHKIEAGDVLITTTGGSCWDKGEQLEVREYPGGEIYVMCNVGVHYLEAEDDGQLLGFRLAD